MGLFGSRQAGCASLGLGLFVQSLLDEIQGKVIVVGQSGEALDGIGIGNQLERGQVGDSRHRDEVARGRVVAKGLESQGCFRGAAGGYEGCKGGVSQAVEFAGGHVAHARGMIVDGVVEAVEYEQFVAVRLEKGLVAHAAIDVLGRGGESVFAVG